MQGTDRQLLRVDEVRGVTVVRFVCRELKQGDFGEPDDLTWYRDRLYRLVEQEGCARMILDFGGVEYVASMMLGVLISLQRRAAKAGGRLALCNVTGLPRKIIDLSGLTRVFQIYEDEPSALASF
jgi:anti-anti-sigma factor